MVHPISHTTEAVLPSRHDVGDDANEDAADDTDDPAVTRVDFKSLHRDWMMIVLPRCLCCGKQNLGLINPVERQPRRRQLVLQR